MPRVRGIPASPTDPYAELATTFEVLAWLLPATLAEHEPRLWEEVRALAAQVGQPVREPAPGGAPRPLAPEDQPGGYQKGRDRWVYRRLAERCAALAADPARRAAEAPEVWAMIWTQGSRRGLLAPAAADEAYHAEWARRAIPRYPRQPAADPDRPATLPAAHRRIRELLEENRRLRAELARPARRDQPPVRGEAG